MNELQKPNGGPVVMQPATTTPAFNFFDPVQFDTIQRVCSFFASSDLVPDNYKAQLKPLPAGLMKIPSPQSRRKTPQSKQRQLPIA